VIVDRHRRASGPGRASGAGGLGSEVLSVAVTTRGAVSGLRTLAWDDEIVVDISPGDLRALRAVLSGAGVVSILVRPAMLDLDWVGATLDEVTTGVAVPGVNLSAQAYSRPQGTVGFAGRSTGSGPFDTVVPLCEAIAGTRGTTGARKVSTPAARHSVSSTLRRLL
jgi:hypothetical protein